jgi:hypothetical protein
MPTTTHHRQEGGRAVRLLLELDKYKATRMISFIVHAIIVGRCYSLF